MTIEEIEKLVARYKTGCATTYIPDIPRSPVRTKEYLAGQKAGFSVGMSCGGELLRLILSDTGDA